MKDWEISEQLKQVLLKAQLNEITENLIYSRLADNIRHKKNSGILRQIAKDELKHFNFWKIYTNTEVKPNRLKAYFFYWVAKIFGITFAIKLMEKGEEKAQINYKPIIKEIPGAKQVIIDEEKHEEELIKLIDEEKLNYIGSIVLGLNDALVELTGALAGLSFALQKSRLIALTGLITGIAASFSMAASEYLSNKSEGEHEKAFTSSLYTGATYIITVALLVLPYFLLPAILPEFFIPVYILSLAATLLIAVGIIFLFTYYISVVKDFVFKKRFIEMAALSLSIAALSFLVGLIIRMTLGVDI